jgi:Protein of unknown function (DUF2459)
LAIIGRPLLHRESCCSLGVTIARTIDRLRVPIAATFILALSAACSSLPPRTPTPSAPTDATIFVIRRAWHIDIGFDALTLTPPLAALRADFPGARYLSVGFGDRHYLLSHHHELALLGALWPGPALLLVTGLKATPSEAFGAEQVVALAVTRAQLEAAQRQVWASLVTHQGTASVYARGPYPGSLYYPAALRYSALHTCNTWAAETLRAAALRVHSAGVLFAGQLWRQVRRLQAAPTAPGTQLQGGLVPSGHTTTVL